ncbi:catalase/peroxidase HPI [Cupriavidus sp. BIS7]|uniref:catalase/peroxidase HPI n=1 Tax=Cupriavidus sp. BIS7 TaxID=1217718 RepID=UPI0002DB1B22|nr:catalase/peroxidase HPI [Cupriavidus sp. BIS7]
MNIRKTLKISALAIAVSAAFSTNALFAQTNPTPNSFWWPEQLNLQPLRYHSAESDPMGTAFNYAKEFKTLDLQAVKRDIAVVMKTSQAWWPADYGTYAPFFVRMAWHSAGVYRIFDGRGGASGGQQRFEPLNSWPDNVGLDKARRLLWPVKQKYGKKISWGDLMVLAGNVALEEMGFKTFGFAGGRADDWEAEMVDWGPEKKMLAHQRHDAKGTLNKPFAATEMGLIYVNPEGPGGKPDPMASAKVMRDAFGRMGMDDVDTVALIAGGHTFGKAHGAHDPAKCVGKEPAAAGIEEQGLGWVNKCGTGVGVDATGSGLEGAWSTNPTRWTHEYLTWLYSFDWEKSKSPSGAIQWVPKDNRSANFVPDAHDPKKRHPLMMFTTDIALKVDPEYQKISKRFLENPKEFELAFAKAWFKLTHRDMGPKARYLGAEVPSEDLLWQDPISKPDHKLVDGNDVAKLKSNILASGLTTPELVRTAWASAATFRVTDMRGGANGARIRLVPQKDWEVNDPAELARVLSRLEAIQKDFNLAQKASGKKVSLADMIVLGGVAAVEDAARKGGYPVQVPFTPGRMDASPEQTSVPSFAVLEPAADGFRNYYGKQTSASPAEMLVERASYLNLRVPEMTVLVGGMRALDANAGKSRYGVLTDRPGTLSNDFFVNLLDMSTKWSKSSTDQGTYEGRDRETGKVKWTATPVDLIFGSNSELRAVAEVYGADDGKEKFVQDFAKAWAKVMNLDRFDQF